MKNAWMVIRIEPHIDDRFWVCMAREDAMKIAKDVSDYWRGIYSHEDIDKFGDTIQGDSFSVTVIPQEIRQPGEWQTK